MTSFSQSLCSGRELGGVKSLGTRLGMKCPLIQTKDASRQDCIRKKSRPFEGEELQDLQELLSRIEVPFTAEEYIPTEDSR